MKTRLVSLPDFKKAAGRNHDTPISFKQAEMKPTSFLVSWGREKTFCIKTYGCQANVRDSEILRGYLLALGMKEQEDFDDVVKVTFPTLTYAAIRKMQTLFFSTLAQSAKMRKITFTVNLAEPKRLI